jgi:hypothetical protein
VLIGHDEVQALKLPGGHETKLSNVPNDRFVSFGEFLRKRGQLVPPLP